VLVGDRLGGVRRDRRVVRLERPDLVLGVDAQEHLDERRRGGGRHGDVGVDDRREERPRLAVVDDAGDLLGREVRVDAREGEARPLAAPCSSA